MTVYSKKTFSPFPFCHCIERVHLCCSATTVSLIVGTAKHFIQRNESNNGKASIAPIHAVQCFGWRPHYNSFHCWIPPYMRSIQRAVLIARFRLSLCASENRLIERTLKTKSSKVEGKKSAYAI